MTPLREEYLTLIIENLVHLIRQRWDKLGCLEANEGAFATGHVPAIAPHAYLCRFYAGLSNVELDDAEVESERYLPPQYRDFLRLYNGGGIMGVSLNGLTGGQNHRKAEGIGQPVSIRYQNAFYLRPDFIPEGHFGLGTMNGPWYSQGHLYLNSLGEVELINSDHDLPAAKWSSFAEFLKQEIPRQLSRYDDEGRDTGIVPVLPGNTDHWEALGKETSDRRKKESTIWNKTVRKINEFRKKK